MKEIIFVTSNKGKIASAENELNGNTELSSIGKFGKWFNNY